MSLRVEKNYKQKKKWLALKVENLQKYYNEILASFKQRLDAVVNPTLNKASVLLAETDEEVFFSGLCAVGVEIEKCANDLFDIDLFCCHSEELNNDESGNYLEPEGSCSSKSKTLSTGLLDSFNKSPNICDNSSSNASFKEQNQCLDEYKKIVSSPVFPETSLSESANQNTESISPLSTNEIDILLLHDITINSETPVLVSDVINPSFFSVQPEKCKEQLVEMQQLLNKLYTQPWTHQLKFPQNPKLGTICVALFDIDKCWYRAKILKELPDQRYQVIYIDYGNHNSVRKDDLRIIDPKIGNVPQMCIQCSLFGIEPTPNKSDVSNPGYSSLERALNWSTPAQEWFDQEVFGKRYLAQFTPNSNCHIPRYSCRLYNVDQALNERSTASSVSDDLVYMGYACHTLSVPNNRKDERGGVFKNLYSKKFPLATQNSSISTSSSKHSDNNNSKLCQSEAVSLSSGEMRSPHRFPRRRNYCFKMDSFENGDFHQSPPASLPTRTPQRNLSYPWRSRPTKKTSRNSF